MSYATPPPTKTGKGGEIRPMSDDDRRAERVHAYDSGFVGGKRFALRSVLQACRELEQTGVNADAVRIVLKDLLRPLMKATPIDVCPRCLSAFAEPSRRLKAR